MKNTFYEFDPVLYPIKLWVVVTNNNDILNDRFSWYPEENIKIDFDKATAVTGMALKKDDKALGVLIVFENSKQLDMKNITHETSHAIKRIWNHLNEEYFGDEATAYLAGWIADCCWKVKTGKL